jgi:RNA polymerase sigma-70 factor (ECF subfamily)
MDESVPHDPVEPATFERALLPHRDGAYNLARWLMRHDQDAEDCVQEAYLRAYQAFHRFRGGDGRTWLLAIVRNVCYSKLRRTRNVETPLEFDETRPDHSAPTGQDSATWQHALARELLPQAMEQLPAEAREIIILHEMEGLSYKDIAAVIEIPLGTVMSRLARARAKLQAQLQLLLEKDLSHGL